MKVYLELPVQSRGLQRVYDALVQFKPDSVEIITDPKIADLTVIHVIGRYEQVKRQIGELVKGGRKYSMIQYCLKSTLNPQVEDWINLWCNSKLVWSYYDLFHSWVDVAPVNFEDKRWKFPFYHAPLGVDPNVFYDRKIGRDFVVGCSCKKNALAEGVRECAIAAEANGYKTFHLGHDLRRKDVIALSDISDNLLASMWSRCEFVSGLRRIEGFEQPVIEGALCGARPIVYDQPHYRKWFNEFAIFIPEGDRDEVIANLTEIFKKGTRPVTEEEKALIRERFNWESIIKGFWERVI